MTGCGIMSSVWAMILQRDSTKKVSIAHVATRHCRDMTEQLLKATFNKNKQIFQFIIWVIILILKRIPKSLD